MTQKILIIDDDQAFESLLEKRLKSFLPDSEVSYFTDLSSAREFLNTNDISAFDLVIIDEHLPDGRGADMIGEGWFKDLAVLSVSSDDAPEIPGKVMQAGGTYFLGKDSVRGELFQPLIRGLIDRNKIQRELNQALLNTTIIDTVKTLVGTLRHEINNPLGAVLGAAYILRESPDASDSQKEAAELVESSGKRIKHVLDKLCDAIALDAIEKGQQKVFHIPGDEPWEQSKPSTPIAGEKKDG